MAATRPTPYAEPELLVVRRAADGTTEVPSVVPPEVASDVLTAAAPSAPAVVHHVDIVETGSFARAVCAGCGWSGPARRSRGVAGEDGSTHS